MRLKIHWLVFPNSKQLHLVYGLLPELLMDRSNQFRLLPRGIWIPNNFNLLTELLQIGEATSWLQKEGALRTRTLIFQEIFQNQDFDLGKQGHNHHMHGIATTDPK